MANKPEPKSTRRPNLIFNRKYHTPQTYQSKQKGTTSAQQPISEEHTNSTGPSSTVQSTDFETILERIKAVQDVLLRRNADSNADNDRTADNDVEQSTSINEQAGRNASKTVNERANYDYQYFKQELKVDGLNAIYKHLWLAGTRGNISPLHRQCILGRAIVKSEDPELHLVWKTGRIYMKPLPPFLITADFWEACLDAITSPNPTPREGIDWHSLIGMALGMLKSYSCLIAYPSDYDIAKEMRLIPNDSGFENWFTFLHDDLIEKCNNSILNKRYLRGELRLSRLNMIYRLTQLQYVYFEAATEYYEYFATYLSLLLFLFTFFSIVLAALQVLLAAKADDSRFNDLSYYFVIVTLIFCVSLVGLCLVLYLLMNLWNICKAIKRNFVDKCLGKRKPGSGEVQKIELESISVR